MFVMENMGFIGAFLNNILNLKNKYKKTTLTGQFTKSLYLFFKNHNFGTVCALYKGVNSKIKMEVKKCVI